MTQSHHEIGPEPQGDPTESIKSSGGKFFENMPSWEDTLSTWAVVRRALDKRDAEREASASEEITEPTRVGYIIQDLVGTGGSGEVWSALQVSLDRVVAVKRIQERHFEAVAMDHRHRRELEAVFRQEALFTARLEHPNIIPIYDIGVDEKGRPLMAMKLVKGEPWNYVLRHDHSEMPYEEYLEKHLHILVDMMQAVAFAHSKRIVHRDIKPAQVMVGEYGEVLLMDWGLAIEMDLGTEEDAERLRAGTGMLLPSQLTASNPAGTPALMAPEQTDVTAERVGPHTDVYLIGSTLYYILTGNYPHSAPTSSESMQKARDGEIIEPSKMAENVMIPKNLEAICLQALEKEPEDRIPSVKEFIALIQDHLSGASNRRESESLAVVAQARLETLSCMPPGGMDDWSDVENQITDSTNTDADYDTLANCLSLLDQSFTLWTKNPRVGCLRHMTLVIYSELAIRSGDLRLARNLVRQIPSEEVRKRFERKIAGRHAWLKGRETTRTISFGVVGVLVLIIAIGAMKYTFDLAAINQRLADERDAAEWARAQSEVDRAKMERLNEVAERARFQAEKEQYFSTINFASSHLDEGRIKKARDILLNSTPAHLRGWEWGLLLARSARDRMTLYEVPIDHVALHADYSSKGDLIATGDGGGSVKIWETATGRLVREFPLADRGIWHVEFSPDDEWLLVCSFDQKARLVDAVSGEVLHLLEGSTDVLRGGAISPDGTRVLTTSRDRHARMWDVETGEAIMDIQHGGRRWYDAEFSPDGSRVALAGGISAYVADSETGEVLFELGHHPENVLGIDYSPDGKRIVTACTDRNARVFDAETGQELLLIANQTSWLHDAVFSHNGAWIATSDNDGTIRLWEAESGNELASLQAVGITFKVNFDPSDKQIVSASDGAVQVWDVPLPSKGPVVRDLTMSAVATIEPNEAIRVHGAPLEPWFLYDRRWNVPEGRTIIELEGRVFAVDAFGSAWSPDRSRQVSIEYSKPVHPGVLLDNLSGAAIATLGSESAYSAVFSPDGQIIGTVGVKGAFQLWDGSTGELLRTIAKEPEMPENLPARNPGCLAFSPDGNSVLMLSRGERYVLFDVHTGEMIRELGPKVGALFHADFSPDGTLVAAGGHSGIGHIWDVTTGERVAELAGHQDFILGIRFGPDGARVLTSSHDDTVKLWEVESGREILTLFRFPGRDFLLAADFLQNGRGAYAVTAWEQVHVEEAFPFLATELPGTVRMDMVDRFELYKRRQRLSSSVTIEDVLNAREEIREARAITSE